MDKLPFIPNQIYNRRQDIHGVYHGNRQGGICPSSTHPYIFIFTGDSGKQHGYDDFWDNKNVFSYTGEGQIGDMQFIRGNLALRRHLEQGKRVFLFEKVDKMSGFVRFRNELEIFDADFYEAPDTNGDTRVAIKFFFKIKGQATPILIPSSEISKQTQDKNGLYSIILPNITERSGIVTSRVGQGAYRKRIVHHWNYQCAVTGFDKLEVLIASHILPWAEADNHQRLDVHNGLLLSPTYDALFDRHLISFETNGKIILSDTIETSAYEKIGVTGTERINVLTADNNMYMDFHRARFDSKS